MNFRSCFDEIKSALLKPQKDYQLAKQQAQLIDELLGYQCLQIEKWLIENHNIKSTVTVNQQFWIGLDLQSLQTPYSEIVEMLNVLQPQNNDLWLDLGAGYGRMGVVLGFLQPLVQFIGYEYVEKRVNEGNRIFEKWKINNAHQTQVDLTDKNFKLPLANVYFIYDFGSKNDIFQILERLRQVALYQPIKVIARGRGVKNWIMMDLPWLSEVNPPEHFGNWSLFRS